MTKRLGPRAIGWLAALPMALFAVSTAVAEPVAVGATVPDLALTSIDDDRRALSERDGSTILVFFRGAW